MTPNNILVWTGAYRSKCLYKELFNNVAGIEALTFSLAQWSLVGENFLRSPPSFQVFTWDLGTAHGQLMTTMRVMKSFVLNKEQIFFLLDQPSQSTVLTSNSNKTLAQSVLQTGSRPIYYQHCIVRIPDDWNTQETQRSKLPYLSVAWCLTVLYTKLKSMVNLSTNSVPPISPEKRIDTWWTPIWSARWTICNKEQKSGKITCLLELEFFGHPVLKVQLNFVKKLGVMLRMMSTLTASFLPCDQFFFWIPPTSKRPFFPYLRTDLSWVYEEGSKNDPIWFV